MLWQVLPALGKLKARMDPFDLGQVLILVVSQALTHLASFVLFKSSLVAVLADPNHAGLLIKFESLGDS